MCDIDLYGHQIDSDEDAGAIELCEICIATNPRRLRDIARFLVEMAARKERDPNFNHAHYSYWTEIDGIGDTEIIVS